MTRPLWLLPLLLTACPDEPDPQPDGGISCFVGTPALDAEIQIVHRSVEGTTQTTSVAVPLIQPPQGGKVLLVGVRARNLDGCPLQLSASLRDECNNKILTLERRPVILEPQADGWAVPKDPINLDNFSNLPGCPRSDNDRPMNGEPYLLKVTVTDKSGRTAERTQRITPYCGAEPEFAHLCECECRSRFDREECPAVLPDAGAISGTCWDGGT